MTTQKFNEAKKIVDKREHLLRLIKFFEQGVEAKENFYNGDMRNITYDPAKDLGIGKKWPFAVNISSEELNIIKKSLFDAITQCDTELSKI